MSSRSVWRLIVVCILSSLASSARIRQHVHAASPEKDGNKRHAECGNLIAARTMELMDRITAYFGNCRLDEEHAIWNEDAAVTITEEGKQLLCESRCKDDTDLSAEAPDSSALIATCSADEGSKEALGMVVLHDAFDAIRKSCESNAHVADNSGPRTGVDAGEVVGDDLVVDAGEIIVEDPVVDLPVESPVAPLKGNMVKQLKFQIEMIGVLANRSVSSCAALKKAFKACDYKRNGKVMIQKVDDMLDKLNDSQKAESMAILKEVAAKVNKDPVTDPLTFKDWTFFKLDFREAAKCALEYATHRE